VIDPVYVSVLRRGLGESRARSEGGFGGVRSQFELGGPGGRRSERLVWRRRAAAPPERASEVVFRLGSTGAEHGGRGRAALPAAARGLDRGGAAAHNSCGTVSTRRRQRPAAKASTKSAVGAYIISPDGAAPDARGGAEVACIDEHGNVDSKRLPDRRAQITVYRTINNAQFEGAGESDSAPRLVVKKQLRDCANPGRCHGRVLSSISAISPTFHDRQPAASHGLDGVNQVHQACSTLTVHRNESTSAAKWGFPLYIRPVH